jgi:beta-lactam-binding protein with PASTA domain
VKGLRLAVAASRIHAAHCSRGTVTMKFSPIRSGTVLSQGQSRGARLANGAAVNLVTSRGPRPKKHA